MFILYFVIFCLVVSLLSYAIFYVFGKIFSVNMLFIKSHKKVGKSTFKSLVLSSNKEINIVKNITNNAPRISGDFSQNLAKQILAKFYLNYDYPTYLISVTNNNILSNIYSELAFLKTLENQGTFLNIILLTSCDIKRVYNLKYAISQLDYKVDVVGIYERNCLSSKEFSMLNMLNINYYCGTYFGENVAKYKDYCIKSQETNQYYAKTHSTMQSDLKQNYVLCNFCVEKSKTYNYLTNTEIIRFDFSRAQKREVLSCFLPLDNIKYFAVETHNFYIKIKDFDKDIEYYYFSNKPIFSKAVYNKKGIYFSYLNDSSFLYVFRAPEKKAFSSVLECEREFIKAQTLINNLPKVFVKSNNTELDEIVNKSLPQDIVRLMLKQNNVDNPSFKNFALLINHNAEIKTKTPLDLAVAKYFHLLTTYYGVEFGKSGIYLSYKKDKLIDSKIFFKKGTQNYSVNIFNKNLNPDTYAFGGVEYSGTNYIPYNKLSQSLNLQM